jgi:HSP20 family molecular chaperone IbpA
VKFLLSIVELYVKLNTKGSLIMKKYDEKMSCIMFNEEMIEKTFPYLVDIYSLLDKSENKLDKTVVRVALPGIDKEEVSVKTVGKEKLVISVEVEDDGYDKEFEEIEHLSNIVRKDGELTLFFNNNVDVALNAIQVLFEKGILTIDIVPNDKYNEIFYLIKEKLDI